MCQLSLLSEIPKMIRRESEGEKGQEDEVAFVIQTASVPYMYSLSMRGPHLHLELSKSSHSSTLISVASYFLYPLLLRSGIMVIENHLTF